MGNIVWRNPMSRPKYYPVELTKYEIGLILNGLCEHLEGVEGDIKRGLV